MPTADDKRDQWTEGLATKSEKIRALAHHGVATADIARYLDIRYQHARNVLMECGLHRPKAAAAKHQEDVKPAAGTSSDTWVELSKEGTLAIMPELLTAAGLEPGAPVHVRLNGDCLEVLSRSAALRRAQQIVSRHIPEGVSLVDELIAERRRESQLEPRGAA